MAREHEELQPLTQPGAPQKVCLCGRECHPSPVPTFARLHAGSFSPKGTQKLYKRQTLQSNQQLGARVLHSFHAETVQIHTESVQQ